MDLIGEILWFAVFGTPLIIIPLVLRYNKSHSKMMRLVTGLLLSFVVSAVLYLVSMAILLRDGLGPG